MKIGRITIIFTTLLVTCMLQQAKAIEQNERRAILDATRSMAADKAGQAVRIKVNRLNVDKGWAVLVGNLVAPVGRSMDWSMAENCDPSLDKMLWVVLHKSNGKWHVKNLDICASEPPYWDLTEFGGFVWPCGVYAGLETGMGEPLDKQCNRERTQLEKAKRK